jgi:lipopolysaccharide transport system permease protein
VSLFQNRYLLYQLIKRDIAIKYRGSAFGFLWAFLIPALMLVVYTFVFSMVFKARWVENANQSKTEFAVVLFVGMMIHGVFAEILSRAPTSVLASANLVKKVVFPLEILPIVPAGSAIFQFLISFGVLSAGVLFLNGSIPPTALLLPFALLPFFMLCFGLAWIVGALGVFVRDTSQVISLLVLVLCFISPVFYPIDSVPLPYRQWLYLSPLTFVIEQARSLLIWGNGLDWLGLAIYSAVSLAIFWFGFYCFQKTRKGFADVM